MQRLRALGLLARGVAGVPQEACPHSRAAFHALPALRAASADPSPILEDSDAEEAHELFRAADLRYDLRPVRPGPVGLPDDLKFGTLFTDHMFLAEHEEGVGWAAPSIQPFGPLALHPASSVLHYGMCCFEGMKAYAGVDGRPRLFRPEANMARFHRSARRLQLADFDPHEMLECIKQLVRVDSAWLPSREGCSMYIRPFAFSSAHVLGIARSSRTTMSVVLSPVGPYFPTGLHPIRLFVDEQHTRAWPGGVGDCKVGGNYAPTILPQVEAARQHGAQQVLYTFVDPGCADEGPQFEESGSMNVFFFMQRRDGSRVLATPALDGKILPGITRDSILALARGWGEFDVQERRVGVREVQEAAAEGRLLEVFGSGTACIVQPVSALVRSSGETHATQFDPNNPHSLAARIHRRMMDIYHGRVDHPWSVAID